VSKFIHSITRIRTPRDESTLDDYGQPAEGTPDELTFKGLIQPQAAREQDDSRSAGAEIADHIIFTPIMDLESSDALEADGRRYAIVGVRRFEYGGLAHLEVGARRISGARVGSEGS
jgi:hypothetical protein